MTDIDARAAGCSAETGALTPKIEASPRDGASADPRFTPPSNIEEITFRSRRWVRPEDLNAHGTLFGGSLLRWIDEEAAIYAIIQLGNSRAVTKYISEINFISSAKQGDLIEMGLRATKFGRTSLTMRAEVRNMITRRSILTIDRIVFVSLDAEGCPTPHGFATITFDRDRVPTPDGSFGR